MAIDFIPKEHLRGKEGVWLMRPFDPRFANIAAEDAAKITAHGDTVAPIPDDGLSFEPPAIRSRLTAAE